jgi:glucokinase
MNIMPFSEVSYVDSIPRSIECILVADVGGTNTNFGIFKLLPHDGRRLNAQLLFSIHYKSREITNFTAVVAQLLAYIKNTYDIVIHRSCIAAAGVVSANRDYCKPTNLTIGIDSKDIIANTSLSCAVIVNDFEVIGHGLSKLPPEKLVQITTGSPRQRGNKIILGAGTGLGKCILIYDSIRARYMPTASEGGHADCALQTELELSLAQFIQKTEKWRCNISWEDVLSGNGIARMYAFFKQRNQNAYANAQLSKNGLHADEIFKSRTLDEHARQTYQLYATFYARCAKNFALDALALGGVYIAGGIASKNVELFQQSNFKDEFINCGKQQKLLQEIPITVIADYNVSLYGAAEYMILEGICT